MKKVVLLFVVSVLMLSAAVASAETIKGFLANTVFGKDGIDLAGHDLTLWPDSLPVVAMRLEEATLKTGYGIYVMKTNQQAQAFTDHQFYMLDAKGNDLAKAIVEKSKELHGIYVVIEGSLDKGKDLVTVQSMEEKDHPVVLTPSDSTSSSNQQGSSSRK